MGSVISDDVERAIREPIEASGRTIAADALQVMAKGTNGYPFLIQYGLRLIAAELIQPTRRGYVDFALPYLREYLREHVATNM